MKKLLYAVTMVAAAQCLSPISQADVPEQLSYMVSPAGCQPVSDADHSRLRMTHGVWVFRNNVANVVANLYCPVNFYGNVGAFNNIQLWYKDDFEENPSYGFAHHGYVEAILKARERTASGSFEIDRVDSNQGAQGYSYVNNFGISGGPATGENYHVLVRMYRESTSGDVAFVGLAIDIQ